MPIPAAAFAIPGAIKAGVGLYQLFRGSRMKPERPTYEIPDEVREDVATARRLERSRMPGVAFAEDRIRQGAAQGGYNLRRAATNPNQLLSGLQAIQQQSNVAERSLMEAEAGDYYRRLSNLNRSLGLMSQYKDKAFQLNKMEPYMDEARTKAALTQGGLINAFSGLGEGLMGVAQGKRLNAETELMKDPNYLKMLTNG
jgi:hypothetical protein